MKKGERGQGDVILCKGHVIGLFRPCVIKVIGSSRHFLDTVALILCEMILRSLGSDVLYWILSQCVRRSSIGMLKATRTLLHRGRQERI